jgi:phosphosulfolactate phosphohydrolase-like enzyme
LISDESNHWSANEKAEAAAREWKNLVLAAKKTDESLHELLTTSLSASLGGQNLLSVGNSADIPVCARVDSLSIVPRLNMRDMKITISKPA